MLLIFALRFWFSAYKLYKLNCYITSFVVNLLHPCIETVLT